MSIRKWGAETLVNSTTSGNQIDPVVAALADGGYVIAWEDSAADPDAVKLQIFNADGTRRGDEITAPTFTGDDVVDAALAPLDNGGFVLTFTRELSATDSDPIGVIYDANGNISPMVTNTLDMGGVLDGNAAVSSLGDGYVAVFRDADLNDGDIEFQIVNSSNNNVGNNTTVNTTTTGLQTDPDVTELTNGRFAVVWEDQEGSDTVRGRVFEADGTPVNMSDFFIGTTGADGADPKVTALTNGGFAVTYRDQLNSFPEEGSAAIKVRLFNGDGGSFVGEVLVNSSTVGTQASPDVTALPGGGFFIVWADSGGQDAIRGQAFNALGDRVGPETVINTGNVSVGSVDSVSVATLADGRLIVTWETFSSSGDGSGDGILSQIIDPRNGQIEGTEAADTLYGNTTDDQINSTNGDDVVFGLRGDDVIFGGDGDDELWGELGDDILVGGRGGDVLDGGDGEDTASYASSIQAVEVNLRTDIATGGEANGDTLRSIENVIGSQFNDILTAEGGNSTLEGLGGDDDYRLYEAGNIIIEREGGGSNDRVRTNFDYQLQEGVFVEQLTTTLSSGTSGIDLTGNSEAQTIIGNAGNNILNDGGGGMGDGDFLRGLGGNDDYRIFNSETTIGSESAAQGSADRVRAAVDFNLGNGLHIETISTILSSSTDSISLTGNALEQTIIGNNGDNFINDGGAGEGDFLRGLGGNDSYRIFNSDTTIGSESSAQGSFDRILTSVDYDLTDNLFIEQIQTNSGAGTASIDLTGNNQAQTIIGNSGSNRLDGEGGNDVLRGLGGSDVFVFAQNYDEDTIDGFQDDVDEIDLTAFNFGSVNAALATATQVGSSVLFNFGNGDTLVVLDTLEADLSNDILI